VVRDGLELAHRGQPRECVADQVLTLVQDVEDLLLDDEEPSVDPDVQVDRRPQPGDPGIGAELDCVERRLRRHREQARGDVAGHHVVDDLVHRRVGQHVAVVGQEGVIVLQEGPDPAQPLTDRGVDAGVDEGDLPLADVGVEELDVLAALRHHEVVGDGLLVVQEVVLDRGPPEAQAQDELGVAEVRVVPHDVPQDRPVADRHHRFRCGVDAAAHPQPEPPAEDHDLHLTFLPPNAFSDPK